MTELSKVNKKEFWEDKYIQNHMPWDIGQAAPAFVKYFTRRDAINRISTPGSKKIAVLGSGRGHDAFYLANCKEHMFDIYGFDFSDAAIDFCNELKNKNNTSNVSFHLTDFFQMVNDKKWENYFDYVIEHTSFCAVDPKRREEYINLIKYLLKPGGKLVGLFFMRSKELGGPPFGSTPEEIKKLFKEDFNEVEELNQAECLHSNLNGIEYFGVFEKH